MRERTFFFHHKLNFSLVFSSDLGARVCTLAWSHRQAEGKLWWARIHLVILINAHQCDQSARQGITSNPELSALSWPQPRKETETLSWPQPGKRRGRGLICGPSRGLDLVRAGPWWKAKRGCGWDGKRSLWNGSLGKTWSRHGQEGNEQRDKELFFSLASWTSRRDAYLCMCVCVCLELPRGEPHALTEGFADAISYRQGSVWVSLVGAQQKQHLHTHG